VVMGAVPVQRYYILFSDPDTLFRGRTTQRLATSQSGNVNQNTQSQSTFTRHYDHFKKLGEHEDWDSSDGTKMQR